MPLTDASLKAKINQELTTAGFVIAGEHARISDMATAIAKAVIAEITTNGTVIVAGGSSSGTYQVT